MRSSAPFHQHLAGRQGEGCKTGQNCPLRRAELAAQGVSFVAVDHGIRQAGQVEDQGCGQVTMMAQRAVGRDAERAPT
jgi:hypothetical protein